MKKWLPVVVLLLLVVVAAYLVLPSVVHAHQQKTIAVNRDAFYRKLLDDRQWKQWWPGAVEGTTLLRFDGRLYRLTEKKSNALVFDVQGPRTSFTAVLHFLPSGRDSVHVGWEASIPVPSGLNRVAGYFEAKQARSDLGIVLDSLHAFFSDPDRVYGLHIVPTLVSNSDSTLISTYDSAQDYPSNELVYGLIGQLQQYAVAHGARVTGAPMLHVTTSDSLHFLTRVALPVSRILPSSGKITYRWMMAGGKIVVAEVRGGPAHVQQAFRQVEQFITDHQLVSPAIPFQSLVTDRRHTDSSQWITRIYYPVM